MNRMAIALSALLLAGVPAGASAAAPYQNGVTTEDDVLAKLGQPDTFTLQPDGSVIYGYQIEHSPWILGVFPLLGLLVDTLPDTTTVTFTFDLSTRLTSYSES